MFALIVQVFRSHHRACETSVGEAPSPAATLMEGAGSRAGLDARAARELRSAASAWLRVVR